MVEPPEVARVLDGKGDAPAITGLTVGTVRLDEKVAHQSTERVAVACGHGGADRVVIGPRDEGNVAGFALRFGAIVAPIVGEKVAGVQILDSCAAPVEDRSQRPTLIELAEQAAETADPLLEARPSMWSAEVEDVSQHRYPRMVPLTCIVARADGKRDHPSNDLRGSTR